ncbi:restriction endonuclease subunit S [Vibrio furnissii]|uniref:restriction endonuclease subunit S n=1 Tax=Vibrio furnissii TaxID=29494 RepID=UPI001EE9D5D1|nr:restriction endonuclease subunit S [Vibrio furnissii]MCG6231729.1 restriction endonuclease subunit S [Vibrio furnissii]MCG6258787.1 restriction endonuclease subunit S [Vibrio furnissii]
MDKTVGLACNISTGKLDANQAVSGGKYPFFTCAEFPDNIDHFAYDDDVVLVAGNNARGNFHVSRYKGKFNAYQRTYILTAKEGINIDYIYYALKLELKRLRERAQGSQTKFLTMPILTGIHLRDVTGDEQTEIANVLSALDKKIELNNRINIELEAMAKTLYEYWFVQFDFPDANGKPYKASGGKMVYNDTLKREIPQDWKVNKLVEITSLIRRGISPKYTEESGTQVLNQKCIRNQKISFEDSRRHQAIMDDNDERLLKPFDVLVNSTGVGTLGRVAYVKRLAEKKTTVDSHVSIVRANPDKVCPRYLAWKLMRYQPVIEAAANGSTGQVELSKSFLEDLDVIIPSGSVAKNFSEFVEPIAISVAKRESENEQLISLRDWLLPMLMNGQVTVKPSTEAQEAQHG